LHIEGAPDVLGIPVFFVLKILFVYFYLATIRRHVVVAAQVKSMNQ